MLRLLKSDLAVFQCGKVLHFYAKYNSLRYHMFKNNLIFIADKKLRNGKKRHF